MKSYFRKKKEMVSILLFACIFALANAWTEPKPIMFTDDWDKIEASYYDPESMRIHLLFHFKNRDELLYLRLNKERIEFMFSISSNFSSTPSITGNGDGKHIYISFMGEGENVMFMESETGGESWKTSQISHHPEQCRLPTLVLLNDTNRLYLTYVCSKSLIFVTRPPGSTTFSKEQILFGEKDGVYEARSCYTFKDRLLLIHIAVLFSNGSSYYMQSENNGISWSKPRLLSIGTNKMGYINAYSSPRISNSFFIFYLNSATRRSYMIYSNDNGETFSKPIEAFGSVVMCAKGDNKILIVAAGIDYVQIEEWESDDVTVTHYTTPFHLEFALFFDPLEPKQVMAISHPMKDLKSIAYATRNWQDPTSPQ